MMYDQSKMTPATRRAIRKYGALTCIEAFRLNDKCGEGANTISWMLVGLPNGKTNSADAAINAGRELVTGKR